MGFGSLKAFSNLKNYRFWQSLLNKAFNLSINLILLSYDKYVDLITQESKKSIILVIQY